MTANEPVEIKVTLAGDVPRALDTLGLGAGSMLAIWFLEDLTPGLRSALPLLSAGIILRLRRGDESDSTVKLRPCRRSQLTYRWTKKFKEDGIKYRIEADWAGRRRALAASCVADLDPDRVSDAVTPGADLSKVFERRQQEFLAECADLRITLAGLIPLGPIAATRWKNVNIDGLEVDVERWRTVPLDFLELSIRVEDDDGVAEQQQAAFEASVRARGLSFDDVQETKTRRVLEHLAQARRGGQ